MEYRGNKKGVLEDAMKTESDSLTSENINSQPESYKDSLNLPFSKKNYALQSNISNSKNKNIIMKKRKNSSKIIKEKLKDELLG